jgi:hypothetical protein
MDKPTIDELRSAVVRLVNREHTLSVPPQSTDEDMVLLAAMDELAALREQNALMLGALETYVRECHDCKDGYIDGLRCGHCWTARDTLAKVKGATG